MVLSDDDYDSAVDGKVHSLFSSDSSAVSSAASSKTPPTVVLPKKKKSGGVSIHTGSLSSSQNNNSDAVSLGGLYHDLNPPDNNDDGKSDRASIGSINDNIQQMPGQNMIAQDLYNQYLQAQAADQRFQQDKNGNNVADRSPQAQEIMINNAEAISKLQATINKYNVLASAIPADSGPILRAKTNKQIWILCQRMRQHATSIKNYDQFMENALLIYMDKINQRFTQQNQEWPQEAQTRVRNNFKGHFFTTRYLQEKRVREMQQNYKTINDCRRLGEDVPDYALNYQYAESIPDMNNLGEEEIDYEVTQMEKYLINMCKEFPSRRNDVRVAFNRNPVNMYVRRIIAERHCQSGKYAYVNKKRDGTFNIKFKSFPKPKKRRRNRGGSGKKRTRKKKEKVGKALAKPLHAYDFFKDIAPDADVLKDKGDDVGKDLDANDAELYKHIIKNPFKGWQIAKLKKVLATLVAAKKNGIYDVDANPGDDQQSIRDLAQFLQGSFADGRTEAEDDAATEVSVLASNADVNSAIQDDDNLSYAQRSNFTGVSEVPPEDDVNVINHKKKKPDIDLTKKNKKKAKTSQSVDLTGKQHQQADNRACGRLHVPNYMIVGGCRVLLTDLDYTYGALRIYPTGYLQDDTALMNWEMLTTHRFYRNIKNENHPFYFIFVPPDSTELAHMTHMHAELFEESVADDDHMQTETSPTIIEYVNAQVHNTIIRKMARYLGVDTTYLLEFSYDTIDRQLRLAFACSYEYKEPPRENPNAPPNYDYAVATPPEGRQERFAPMDGLPMYFARVFHVHGNHYVLGYYDFRNSCIIVWDSLYDDSPDNKTYRDRANQGIKFKIQLYLRHLKMLMFFFMPHEQATFDFIQNDEMPVYFYRCRRQPNSYSCGYHACYNAYVLHEFLYDIHTNGDFEDLTVQYWQTHSYANEEHVLQDMVDVGGIESDHHLYWAGHDAIRPNFENTYKVFMDKELQKIQRWILVQRPKQYDERSKIPAVVMTENLFEEESDENGFRNIEHTNAAMYRGNPAVKAIQARIAGANITEFNRTNTPVNRLQNFLPHNPHQPKYSCIPDNRNHRDQGDIMYWSDLNEYKQFCIDKVQEAVRRGFMVNREREVQKFRTLQRNLLLSDANQLNMPVVSKKQQKKDPQYIPKVSTKGIQKKKDDGKKKFYTGSKAPPKGFDPAVLALVGSNLAKPDNSKHKKAPKKKQGGKLFYTGSKAPPSKDEYIGVFD